MTVAAGAGRGAYRARGTVTGAGPGMVARQSRAARRRQRRVWVRIGLGILRSRPFHERVVLAVIAVAAIVRIAREGQARGLDRLVAWDQRQRQRLQREAGAR
jgi:hypothetical protein